MIKTLIKDSTLITAIFLRAKHPISYEYVLFYIIF